VLSFDTTHAITGCLLHAETDAHLHGWGAPPVLLVLHDQPYPPGPPQLRTMQALSFTLDPGDLAQHAAGIPAALHVLADHLNTPDAGAAGNAADPADASPPLAAIRAELLAAPPARLLAWAVLYEDIHIDANTDANAGARAGAGTDAGAGPDGIGEVRRVDAVDVDGRVYQLTRHRGEPAVVVLIDDQPDPADTPATQPGLGALLSATQRLTDLDSERVTP
jgi:hypothetical protein